MHPILATALLALTATLPAQERAFGHVVDRAGRPVEGVAVALTPKTRPVTGPLLANAAATTDAAGRFSLTQEVFGRYGGILVFGKRGYATMRTTQPRIPAEATDLGTFTMVKGVTLLGVVTDADGNPVPKAWVAASDMLTREQGFVAVPRHHLVHHEVIGFTDEQGRYRLPGALPHGVDLCVSKPGYLDGTRFGVAVGDPLNFTMKPTLPIDGRVVDKDGKPVRGAWVWLKYGLLTTLASHDRGGLRTDADGRFRVWRNRPGMFRVHVNGPRQRVRAHSAVLRGPQDELTVTLDATYAARSGDKPPAEPTGIDGLHVRATGADGHALQSLRAVVWGSMSMATVREQPPWFVPGIVANMQSTNSGTVIIPKARISGTEQVLFVWAPGHAVLARDLSQKDIDRGVRVALAPESAVTGRVVDARTRTPIPGALVLGGPAPGKSRPRPEGWAHSQRKSLADMYGGRHAHGGVRTDGAGRFRLGRLPEGRNLVLAYAPGRPVPDAIEVELERGEVTDGLMIEVASGAFLEVSVTPTTDLDHRCRLRLGPKDASGHWTWNSFQDLAGQRSIPEDGKVTFAGCNTGKHALILMLGNPPRLGHPLTIDLAEIELAKGANRTRLELATLGPLRVAGKVALDGDPIPPQRVIVAVEPRIEEGRRRPELMLEGTRTFMAPDGSFALPAPRRPCHVLAVDAVTGVVFGRSELLSAALLERGATLTLRATTRRVQLRFPMSDGPAPTHLAIRLGEAWPADVGHMSSHEGADTHVGTPLDAGVRELTLWLPPTPVRLRVVSRQRELEAHRTHDIELAVHQEQAGQLAPRIEFGE